MSVTKQGLWAVGGVMMSLGLLAYEGPTFTVTAWRGETAYAPIPDQLAQEVKQIRAEGAATVTLFGVDGVPYTSRIHGDHLAFRRDRVLALKATTKMPPAICRVAVHADAQPGVYDLGPLQLRVIDRVLPPPAQWKYHLDLWQHPWAVARHADVAPFSPEHYAKLKPVMETLAECGQKVLTTTLLELPWNHQCYDAYHAMIGRVRKADGSWSFDYRKFDEYVAFGRKCGIGPDIACYTMCPWGYVVRWQNEKGENERAEARPGTPFFEDYWGDFLVDFADHLKAKGWFEHTYLAMDERTPEDVRQIAAFIRRKVPGFRISMAGNRKPSDFAGITIEDYSQILSDVTPEFLAELDERRAKGHRTTFYVCCAPQRPNTCMTSADDEAFWLGAFPAFSGFDGFLRWAANSWPDNPYANAAFGNWAPGDTFLVYPHGEYSMRLLSLRAGIVAAEKIRILRECGALADEFAALAGTCDFTDALNGKTDFRAFRQQTENLVNR
ncbi:MAG: DUF4091 domain-containing protein [Kiritimatiellia bacterium]